MLALVGGLALISCGSDDAPKKWECTCHGSVAGAACAATEGAAKGLFTCADSQVGSTTFFGIIECKPTGDSCTCPASAPCEIAVPH